LFGIVGDIGTQDREDPTNKSIGAYHINTFFAGLFERCKERAHAVVEYLIAMVLSFLFGETFKFRDRYIAD
jgi:hypothetical protein